MCIGVAVPSSSNLINIENRHIFQRKILNKWGLSQNYFHHTRPLLIEWKWNSVNSPNYLSKSLESVSPFYLPWIQVELYLDFSVFQFKIQPQLISGKHYPYCHCPIKMVLDNLSLKTANDNIFWIMINYSNLWLTDEW